MGNSTNQLEKMLDVLKLVIATISLTIILGGLYCKYTGTTYPIDVNMTVTYLLSAFVMVNGFKVYMRKTNNTLGLFLMLCAVIILILNVLTNARY